MVDDYADPRCQSAVDAFRAAIGLPSPPERVDASAAVWRKAPDPGARAPETTVRSEREAQTKELSLIVVVHDMRREAARTLHSLSRTYQRGADDLDYEVVVVENGSAPEEALGAAFVESFGQEFRYLDMGEDADPSPAKAVNAGIEASTGALVGIMIDGAHVLTPGVLRNAKLAQEAYGPAVVTVKQWYVGPGQQPYAVPAGYDREFEDRLFDHVEWPSDGYRLFEIGHFIGARDWFDGDWESNCIFVPRTLIDQAGAMDEAFSAPGGGFVNLDFYERMSGSPGVNRVTLLGEGSFHQVHGGTTTNAPKPEEREALIASYAEQYAKERGRPFVLPQQRIHYVGSLPPEARRTRRRPMSAEPFRVTIPHADDQRPSKPVPIAENLAESFVDAFWHSQAAHTAEWLGRRTHRPPTDLHVLQELICELEPGWIIETRTGAGGRALFLASICELIGKGRVLSIDAQPLTDRPEHELITYLTGDPAEDSTASEAREILGEDPRALLILGAAASQPLIDAFSKLSPFVPVGSYVVFEDTILEGNPVWPAFGSGPGAAAARITDLGDFIVDPERERFGLTFSPGGFLKRVR